jgi:hypothetical protein
MQYVRLNMYCMLQRSTNVYIDYISDILYTMHNVQKTCYIIINSVNSEIFSEIPKIRNFRKIREFRKCRKISDFQTFFRISEISKRRNFSENSFFIKPLCAAVYTSLKLV